MCVWGGDEWAHRGCCCQYWISVSNCFLWGFLWLKFADGCKLVNICLKSHLYVAYSSSTARQHGYHANDGHGLPLPDLRLLFVCLATVSYSKLQYTSYHDTAHAHAHTLVCMSSSLVNALSWWGSWWTLILYQEHLAWSSNTSYMRHQSIVQHRTHVHSVIHI